MTHKINKTVWMTLAVVFLAAMLLLTAPRALADGAAPSGAADEITIAEDGTATLFSGHIAGEEVCSLQASFTVPEGTAFSFSGAVADRMVSQSTVDGVLTIYISGAEALLPAGQNTLVLGAFTPAEKVRPVENSLAYVYGSRVRAQTLEVAAEELTARELLQALVDEAERMGGELGEPQAGALEKAKEVLANTNATDEELNGAYRDLYEQLYGQNSGGQSAGSGSGTGTGTGSDSSEKNALTALIEEVLALKPTEEEYDKDTLGALNDAITRAQNALESGSEADMIAAREALAAAVNGLKKVGQPRLEAALDAARAKLNDGNAYTSGSRRTLEDAISAAEAVLSDESATSEQRTAAAQALETATADMVPQGADSSGPVYDGNGFGEGGDSPSALSAVSDTASTTAPGGTSAAATAPNTGDGTVLLPWLAVLCLAGAMLAALALRRGKARG